MKTRALYYEDSHLRSFRAEVVSCEQADNGFRVELDRTSFFPGGGGQACDLGTLGGVRVLGMEEDGERVLHICEKPLEVGAEITREIDWERRFDLMQQHSGEHILSGLIHEKFGWHNVGFHMGADAVTIDFDGDIPADWIPELEQKANGAVWQNLPLHIWIPSPEELPGVKYRTKKALPWPVRIVEFPGFDSCACCGVHVKNTGEIGPIKVISCIRFRSGVRMEILCGKRAFDYLSRSHAQNQIVSREFSAPVSETGEAARKMNEQLGQLKFRMGNLERQIFNLIAEKTVNSGDVLIFREDLGSADLRTLAEQVSAVCGGTAAVFSGSDEGGYGYCLGCRGGNLRDFVKEMNAALQGRGGGKPEFQQGSLRASKESIMDYFDGFQKIG